MFNPDYDLDGFEDILAKDSRFHPHAYTLLLAVLDDMTLGDRHVTGEEILDEFREEMLDYFGPLAYTALTELGVKSCEDIGEMMFNLAEGHRINADENDTPESFANGYDFREAFLMPFEP